MRKEIALDIHYTQPGGITGHFMLLIMVLMYTAAHQKIRHQCFEVFWYTHHLAFFFMLGLYTHATGCFVRDSVDPDYIRVFPFYSTEHCLGYNSWRFTIWPGILYFGERILREVRARRATRLSKVLVHPSGTYLHSQARRQLTASRCHGVAYREAQFQVHGWSMAIHPGSRDLKLSVASGTFLGLGASTSQLTRMQFTITSAPEDPYVSVHIRQVGDWTQALGERLGVGPSAVQAMTKAAMAGLEKDEMTGTRGNFVEIEATGASMGLPSVRIDGPFGAPAEDVFNAEVAVLVGAGIGVTPFASILKHIWWRQQRGNLGSLRRVEFFWVCRDTASFGWFQSLLQEVEAAQADREYRLAHRTNIV